MDVYFASRKLERCYHNETLAIRTWGREIGRRYVLRVELLRRAHTMNEVYAVHSLRAHPLAGDRKGEIALTIQGKWRLIIEAYEEGIVVKEVSDHHED